MAGELERQMLRRSLGAMAGNREHCSGCGRTPLPGELLYVFESEAAVCALCRSALPGSSRSSARTQRVHAGERRLAVRRLAA
jgi:hypothetical protein